MEKAQELEEIRKNWEEKAFQRRHALARNVVIQKLRELNESYITKTGHGFIRFVEERMKTPESILEKLQRKNYDRNFEVAVGKLNDISGVRCICYSVREIYWIARQIGRDSRFIIVKVKDYVRKPKKNGYESYHLVMDVPVEKDYVRVELQLRTSIMDAWAEMDTRISYKKDESVPPEMTRRIEKYAKIGRRLDKLIQRTLEEA